MDEIVLTDGEVADLLKVSVCTIRRMWYRKTFPAPIKVGAVNRWRKTDVNAWVDEQKPNPIYEDGNERKLV